MNFKGRFRNGQAMLEYLVVFAAFTLAVLGAVYAFNRGARRAAEDTREIVTSPYP